MDNLGFIYPSKEGQRMKIANIIESVVFFIFFFAMVWLVAVNLYLIWLLVFGVLS